MMTLKQRFCAKIGLDDDSFVFHSSSHNLQSPTANPRFVVVPTSIFFTKKLTLRENRVFTS
ncbi:hypothetical protein G436_4558 [Leptospira interrogans serovar Hardjo str. Norma]|uniref:Uncharacterized protein n=4 Tax=Leptospira interrogans TaxID=173 RepID=Q8EY12_LEPIN|nr:hypothetical protein LB_045 [Leptospira interrogans serovar Lai str. 56601]AER04277.1 hypothetical protein LIF_B034 [Leptospira interrogans serovar Lai str. IPAV]AKP27943.1 hypothetical protein LIMLP_17995 [Leptospira interrogans serovar Manilae]ALE41687.1 hypothetical protein G436_4558 [Leptospira interrogans serovar Hardjo str. Norma]EKO25071.1 hypothetical protein LEP1GSC104_0455 [Leptospira interrogans str. UI 12621]EMM79230.1 hypothetical protein LEP1GSC037_3429 [Leptospira interrogans